MLLIKNALKNLRIQRTLMSFYAVARGHQVGIYDNWAQCESQVKGFKGAKYKKFPTRAEALSFIEEVSPGALREQSSTASTENHAKQKAEYFWPQNDGNCDDTHISEAEMLAAAAEAEYAADAKTEKSRKRKAVSGSSSSSKLLKHASRVWESVDKKCIGGYEFEADEEGFVIVYTDGSCINNGRENACAGYGVFFGGDHPLNAAKPVDGRVTNNVGEIQAAIHAIKVARQVGIKKLCISTDSQFLINAITMWVNAWKRNNWRLKSGEPVKNEVDFKELDELLSDDALLVKWNYVKGHKGIRGNEMADKLAREGSDIYKRIHLVEKL